MAATKSRSRSSGGSRKGQGRQSGGAGKKAGAGAKRASGQAQAAERNGQSTVGRIASKAKGPALAGGAALVGLAGGAALNRNRSRGLRGRASALKPSKLGPKVSGRMPSPDTAVRAVGSAAGQVARRSSRIGQIAAEVQKASEAIDGRSKGSG